jgi:hypothetical protein
VLSDGTQIACASTAECQTAAAQAASWCAGPAQPDLGLAADLSTADLFAGDSGAPAIVISKTGPPYTGARLDPMLGDAASCPDKSLEPNDSASTAVTGLSAPLDVATPQIVSLAICPTGPSPFTGQHDVDFYEVDLSGNAAASFTFRAQITYDIAYGDLDVGLYDTSGHALATDGTAVANGCVAALVTPAKYYVVVVGANNVDSNRYTLNVRSFSASQSCP